MFKPSNLLMTCAFLTVTGMATLADAKTISAHAFVQKASMADKFEIDSSELALQKSQNDEIKSFAQAMIDDHGKTTEEMKQTLASSNSDLMPADHLDKKHQAMLDTLNASSEANFDKRYVSMQTDAHKEAVNLFSDYAKNGRDKTVKAFAAKTLPTLKSHLTEVKKLHAK